jgi:hypothetical protein
VGDCRPLGLPLALIQISGTVENHPEGYPRIAAYINSDDDTVLFRRFGNLHARSLLYKQIELTELEAKLAKLDGDDNAKEDTEWRVSLAIHHENGKHNEERKTLMEEIHRKLEAYGK